MTKYDIFQTFAYDIYINYVSGVILKTDSFCVLHKENMNVCHQKIEILEFPFFPSALFMHIIMCGILEKQRETVYSQLFFFSLDFFLNH